MEGPMKNLFDPAGKVALVTGGTSGLGHAIAEAFLQNGVDVAVCSRHPESAPELAELAAAEGRRYLPVYCDITKEEGQHHRKRAGPRHDAGQQRRHEHPEACRGLRRRVLQ